MTDPSTTIDLATYRPAAVLARLSVFQRRFLRLQFLVTQRQFRWSANPVTSNVIPLDILTEPSSQESCLHRDTQLRPRQQKWHCLPHT